MIGQQLGHYRILEKIGAGGMGEVYRARDEHLGREVAIKILPAGVLADDSARRRFRSEAEALARLNHPHIATVHDFATQDGVDFLVMEFVPGSSLADRLDQGSLPEKEVLRLGMQVAAALEEAHEKRIVHRDLKPANIRLTAKGDAKVLDFGLAKLLRPADEINTQSVTQSQAVVGTLPYMAPEQLRAETVDARTDIYAFGCVLYEMAAGQRPFRETVSATLTDAILNRPALLPRQLTPRLSGELERIILKCLEKDPENRYQSAKEVLVDLRRLATPTAISPTVQPRSVRRWGRYAVAAAGLAGLVVAVLLGFNLGGLRDRLFGLTAPQIDSIAVLPLDNLSRDPEQDYFADGMTEALITELSKISSLKVISRTSVMQYKGVKKPMPQIARELDVDSLVEGSVQREGDQVRITVQLIHGPTDKHLWAESYQRELRGVLSLQSEVARAIASQVRITVTPQEQARLASAHPVNPRAYETYLLGRHYWNQRTIHGYRQAVETFRKAVEQDPGYAPAYAGLADSYMLLGEQGGLSQKQARSLAEAAIRKALEVDDNVAEAHDSLGWWKFHYEWNWAQAEQAFKRAIELNPGDALIRARYGRVLGFLRRFEEATRELQRARELDPLSVPVNAYLGQVYLFARRYDEAAGQLQRALELNPNHALVRHNLGELSLAQGRFAEAIPELERSVELSGQLSGVPSSHYLAILGCAHARANRREDAVKILNELKRRSEQGLVSSFDMAILYVALGEKDQALDRLERGYEQRDIWLVELKAWPWFDSLRDDPRFQALLRRMNFPE